MEEHSLKVITSVGDNELLDKNNSPVTSKDGLRNKLEISVNHEDSDEDDTDLVQRMKKRVRQFSDSESDEENKRSQQDNLLLHSGDKDHSIVSQVVETGSESGSDNDIFNKSKNTRIQKVSKDSESDSDTDTSISFKNKAQQRHKNKRINLKQKFKNFSNYRRNASDSQSIPESTKDKQSQSSDDSNDEEASITEIKKKIKERISSLKTTICDPDTSSDEESSQHKQPPRPNKERRSIKLTSPKPARMSAKQAMENMQKIKSESNRMLREQQVSLPYHRPKALSLKDIINRRKPALSSDGKALPIKMNEDQLKQYVLQLEQRQKEIMELCKSESDEEEPQLNDDKVGDLQSELNTCDNVTETNTGDIETDVNYKNKEHIDNIGKDDIERNEYSNDIDMADNKSTEQSNQPHCVDNIKENKLLEEQDSSIELVYNNSTENVTMAAVCENIITINNDSENIASDHHPDNESCTVDTEKDSQLISLHLDTEQTDSEINQKTIEVEPIATTSMFQSNVSAEMDVVEQIHNGFSDDDINMDEIDTIIENAEIIKSSNLENFNNSPMLIRDPQPFKSNPRLTGAPGMVIDLDGGDPFASKKLTGVELLKERFTYFATLKTPDEMERHRDQKSKPGTLHLKLKQDLEEQIAEQRSLEWAKRLEKEKEHQMELNALRGDASEEEDNIDKIESKLEEDNIELAESSSESEEELLEDDICMKDNPRINNPMVADEAEESDCDEGMAGNATGNDDVSADDDLAADDSDKNESNDESSEEESSESEDEQTKPKKGRILKAFEDSDDEDESIKLNDQGSVTDSAKVSKPNEERNDYNITEKQDSEVIKDSQDDELQLAQRHKSSSWELFTSQDSVLMTPTKRIITKDTDNNVDDDKDLGSQTFSILNCGILVDSEIKQHCPEKLSGVCTTQPFEDNLDAVAAMCSGSFTQNLVNTQLPITQVSQSQPIGEDILALCTGQFYDNQFVSPAEENMSTEITQESLFDDNYYEDTPKESANPNPRINNQEESKKDKNEPDISLKDSNEKEGNLLKSILDELDDPDFDSPKVNKFFNGNSQIKDNEQNISKIQLKKKFIIDSDDETNEATDSNVKKNKLKRKRLENRALQISDDEEEEADLEDEEESYISEIEDDSNRIVEYDSEENEVEINPQSVKKKRKGTDFFEQEAELTSEDEWVGSGDEDEADLDRMEREEGDDDTFHQGKLQRELGQIHLRDVLDQDKREVRIIQELLFEDGDLGEGHRQRKFRWRNADGEEETGTTPDEFADTQEEEFESEEQWRKERHEREIFLRQLKDPDEAEENPNKSVNRTTIIKANLSSKSMSSLLMEVNNTEVSETESPVVAEKIPIKDVPSPKKPFTIFKQNYHGSLLTRGRGALARLAALATPLAVDEDAPKVGSLAPTNRRNFVFTALTPDDEKPKITKRKADVNVNTPRLVKKMKTEDKQKYSKSLLEQLNV